MGRVGRGGRELRAAVLAIVRERDATGRELLLIKRADHAGDPWSGHVALPGGREEPSDASLEETAIRETREELGIDVRRDGRIVGVLDDVRPHAAPASIASMVVRPFVAVLDHDLPLVLSDEVAAAFWVSVAALSAPSARTEAVVSVQGVERLVPSFRHGEHIVWGLTERILHQLFLALPGVLPQAANT